MTNEWKSLFENKRAEILSVVKSQLSDIEQSIDKIYDMSEPIISEITSLQSTKSNLLLNIDKLEEQIKFLTSMVENMEKIWTTIDKEIEKAKYKIKLNVGGTIFVASKTTLLTHKGSYFCGMLSNGSWQPDEDGEYFIDRNPMVFDRILDYMRDGYLDLHGLDDRAIAMLNRDMDYYCLSIPKNESEKTPTPESSYPDDGIGFSFFDSS